MKKNLWLAALVGVVLTGCVNDDSSPMEQQAKKLTFASVIGTQSRAEFKGEIDGAKYPTAEKFTVYSIRYDATEAGFNGWENSKNVIPYFGPVETAHQGGVNNNYWDTVGDRYYWPLDQYYLAFAAYSPSKLNSEAGVKYGKTGLEITNFKTEEISSNQYDLLYSERTVNRNNSNNGNNAVNIKFKHALSSIVFSVQDDVEEKLFTLKKLEVIGTFHTQGNFSQGITETLATETTPYSEEENPSWSLTTSPLEEKKYIPFNRTGEVGSEDGPLVTTHNQYILPQIFTGGEEALLMIPQAVPNDAKVILYFESDLVNLTDNGNGNFTEEKKLGEAAHTEYELSIPLKDFLVGGTSDTPGTPITVWQPGVRYIYRFQFGGTPHIYFSPEVTTWIPYEGTAVYKIE